MREDRRHRDGRNDCERSEAGRKGVQTARTKGDRKWRIGGKDKGIGIGK